MQMLYEREEDPAEQSRALYAVSFAPEVITVLEYAISGKVSV